MRWHLIYTKPRGESLALENLARQGFDVLCPQLKTQKKQRGKWLWRDEPLFPRYLFVGANAEAPWGSIRSTIGVSSLVHFGGVVASVPAKFIEALLGAAHEPTPYRPAFVKGQRVRIVTGEFAALEGIFEIEEGGDRAAVLLDLLGRQTRVRVDIHSLVMSDA